MAITSVKIASRGAAYFAASWSTRAATSRTPSQSCSTSTAVSSGASTRSGARITQTFRVSSNFSLAWRDRIGRLVSLTVMWRGEAMISTFRHECAGRNMALDIGVIERVQLHPQHVGLEDQRIADRFALLACGRMFLDILQRKAGVARRLGEAAAEIAHDVGVDEIIVLQHAADAFFMQVRCEQLGERGGDRFQRRLVAHKMDVGFDCKARRRQDPFGRLDVGAIEAEALGQLQPALDAAL